MRINYNFLIAFIFTLINISCEKMELIGAEDVAVINDVKFSVTELSMNSNSLVAKGIIENNGNINITPPWYIEADFYSDKTYTFKLGGENTSLNFALGPNESTGWQLTFSSSQYNEAEYPNFAVKNLRAYKDPE